MSDRLFSAVFGIILAVGITLAVLQAVVFGYGAWKMMSVIPEVEQHGLRHVLDRVWNGTTPESSP